MRADTHSLMTGYSTPLDEALDAAPETAARPRRSLMLLVTFGLQVAWVINRFLPWKFTQHKSFFGENVFSIHLGVLMLLVFSVFALGIRHVPRIGLLTIALVAMLVSGAITEALFVHPQTYFLYVSSFILTAAFAYQDFVERRYSPIKVGLMPYFFAASFVIGLVLIRHDPYAWGTLPFEFSRESRGMVIFWRLIDLHYVLPAVTVLMLYTRHRLRHVFLGLSIATVVIMMSTYTRTWTVESSMPLVLYGIFRMKSFRTRVIVLSVVGALVLGLYADALLSWFTLSESGTDAKLEQTLTGRLPLWDTYLQLFLQNPIFGFGRYDLVAKGILPSMGATTEVGILTWFAQFGLVFALPMMWILIKATIQATRNVFLGQTDISQLDLFCSIAFLTQLPNTLLQNASRILYVSDLIVYLTMFYLYFCAISKDAPSRQPDAELAVGDYR